MKRIFTTIFVCICFILVICSLGCSHQCEYGELIIGQEATCTQPGIATHYHCNICGKDYDENYRELKTTVIPAGHDFGSYIYEVSATCDSDGTKGHFHCSMCGKDFSTSGEEIADLKIPAGHTFEHLDAHTADCTNDGTVECYHCTRCGIYLDAQQGNTLESIVVEPAKGHSCSQEDQDEYLRYIECTKCHVLYHQDAESNVEEILYYAYDEKAVENILTSTDAFRNKVSTSQNLSGDALTTLENEFETWWNQYDEVMSDVSKSYEYYEARYYIYYDDEHEKEFNDVKDIYNELDSKSDLLLSEVYQSNYKDDLITLDYLPQEIIDYVIENYEIMSNEELLTMKKKITSLELQLQSMDTDDKQFLELYGDLIDVRREYAVAQGYSNYYEMASEEAFGRTYTYEDVQNFKNYCKNFILPRLEEAIESLAMLYSQSYFEKSNYTEVVTLYQLIEDEDCFANAELCDILADYLSLLVDDENDIDCYEAINQLMKEGRWTYGAYETAFTSDGYMLFGTSDTNYFRCINTVIHESGHYLFTNNVGFQDYDYFEINSQGNEMIFQSYLIQRFNAMGVNGKKIAKYILLDKLQDIYSTILYHVIVDDFEYCVYTNAYTGENAPKVFEDGITYDEYELLIETICANYGIQSIGYDFISYYCLSQSVYAISYSISVVPCLDLLIQGAKQFENGLSLYLKTFTFQFDETFEEEYQLSTIMEYAGLTNPFSETGMKALEDLMVGYFGLQPKKS